MGFFWWDAETLSRAQKASLLRVVASHQHLLRSNERLGARSDDSTNACRALLEALPAAAKALKVDMAPRVYRRSFNQNYRVLFRDECRHYRVDVLEASIDRYLAIWVNGEKFEFSPEAISRATALQESWAAFLSMLDHCGRHDRNWLPRSTIRNIISTLDLAWARFEHQYISELIIIEVKARHSIVKAVEAEAKLWQLEGSHTIMQSCRKCGKEQASLVWWISRLNSLANVRRKGRDDLGVDVLYEAIAILHRCDAAEKSGKDIEASAAPKVLAINVIESFDAMRRYLRHVANCLECVDPQLSNNAGLVDCLVDWEASWEVGTQYIQNQEVLNSLCDLVAYIQQVQRLVPAFASMFQNYDPEVFMILPRLILLRFLKVPELHSKLAKSLVLADSAGDDEFHAFKEQFQSMRQEFTSLVPKPQGMSAELAAWDMLTRGVVSGVVGCAGPHGTPEQHVGPVRRALEELMHALEPWSIKLQRHCPQDWNQCVAVITECLQGEPAVRHTRKARAERARFRI